MDLRRLASQLLARYSLRDPAPTIETWNTQYSTGRWTFVGQLWELSRFSVLVGYLRHFARGGAILDVGCGQGFLPQRLQPDDYKRYVGIRRRDRQGNRASFAQGDVLGSQRAGPRPGRDVRRHRVHGGSLLLERPTANRRTIRARTEQGRSPPGLDQHHLSRGIGDPPSLEATLSDVG